MFSYALLRNLTKYGGSFDKLDKMTNDFDRMFLFFTNFGNVPRYPVYPGYQLFATLCDCRPISNLQGKHIQVSYHNFGC